MNKDKVIELARKHSLYDDVRIVFMPANAVDFAVALTEPLEKRIDEVLGYWNNSEKQYVDVVEELGMAEKIIADLKAELAHMTMAADVEAQRVDELTAEKLAVSPEVVAYLAETNTDLSDPQLYFDKEDARRAGFVVPLGRIVPKEQPVAQEPLAWAFTDDPSVFAMPGSGVSAGKEPPEDAINIYPLYAAPVQQVQKVPLTAKELIVLLEKHHGYGSGWTSFARDVEAHHGIGSKT